MPHPDLFAVQPENEPPSSGAGAMQKAVAFRSDVKTFLKSITDRQLHWGEVIVGAEDLQRKYGL